MLAQIKTSSSEEIQALLLRAQSIQEDDEHYALNEPVVLVLSGQEIELFVRSNYREQKALVDLAARLSAFAVVRLEVSQSYLQAHNLSEKDLPSFIAPVADGNAQIQSLKAQGYVSLSVEDPA